MLHTDTTDSEPAFTVALCDYPDLPETERLRAEMRYAKVLTRQLGSETAVCETLRLVQSLEETPPEDISPAAQQAYHRWAKAVRAAAEAGLQGLGGEEACFFDVQLH